MPKDKDKTPSEVLSELMNVPFPNPAYLEAMQRVFAMQKRMLDDFHQNLDKWFDRRREGADAALTMIDELKGERDTEKRAEAWQRWVSGAMARIMDDVQTQFDAMSKLTGQLAENGEVKVPAEMKAHPMNGKSGTHAIPKKTATPRPKPTEPRETPSSTH
jgi:hypothetical protein